LFLKVTSFPLFLKAASSLKLSIYTSSKALAGFAAFSFLDSQFFFAAVQMAAIRN
jgi:hypothetical protein